jgi:hypothetical protein
MLGDSEALNDSPSPLSAGAANSKLEAAFPDSDREEAEVSHSSLEEATLSYS